MNQLLDNKISLYIQVKNDLIRRIRSGEMLPNAKVPSERELAETFGISRGTAKQALQELETEHFIERIPAKGSYVRDVSENTQAYLNILFPFPEKSISILREYANSVAVMEIYRGMMSACDKYNIRVTFQHFMDTESKEKIRSQAREVGEFYGAIFLGRQLNGLRKELYKHGIPFVTIHSHEGPNIRGATVVYNRAEMLTESAHMLADAGYKSVGMLTTLKEYESKENICANVFEERGVEFSSDWLFHLEANEEMAYKRLTELLPDNLELLPEVFFCGSPVYSFAFLRIAAERNWKVPDDIGIFGYANDMSIRPTVPTLSHVYVPYFEMGENACRVLVDGIRGESVVPGKIIKGETIRGLRSEV